MVQLEATRIPLIHWVTIDIWTSNLHLLSLKSSGNYNKHILSQRSQSCQHCPTTGGYYETERIGCESKIALASGFQNSQQISQFADHLMDHLLVLGRVIVAISTGELLSCATDGKSLIV